MWCGRRKSWPFVSTRFFDFAQNDKVFILRPKRKLVRSVLINGMCIFEDGTRTATAATILSVELDEKYKRLHHSPNTLGKGKLH